MKNTKFSNSEVDGPITGAAFKGQFAVCKYLLNIIYFSFNVLILFLLVAGNILCDHFLYVYLCLLHCFQNEVLQLLLLCTQASDRP